jgi:pimeloyl-ACP methyl ester carboxylesterase
MGGQTALSLTVAHPDRVRAVIVTGAEIDPWSPREDYEEMLAAIEAEGMDAVAREFDTTDDPLPDWYKRQILATEPHALIAAMRGRLAWPGVSHEVERMKMPVLFFGGEYEYDPGELESMVKRVPNASGEIIKGVGHINVFARSDLVLPRARAFLDRAVDQ